MIDQQQLALHNNQTQSQELLDRIFLLEKENADLHEQVRDQNDLEVISISLNGEIASLKTQLKS